MIIVVDSREQTPYIFGGEKYPCEVRVVALTAGDYSLLGLERDVAIERKELNDLIGCLMGAGRDRFERELARLRGYKCKAVVIDASMDDVRQHHYRSKMLPHAVLQSIITFQVRYNVPFVWADSRDGGEYWAYWTLEKFAREQEGNAKSILQHLGAAA